MHKRKSIDYTVERKKVANLILGVITNKLIVREALKSFPLDCEDETIKTVWYALCHLEADEEMRVKDDMYRQEQDEYINFLWQTLSKGEELPVNIIEAYRPFYTQTQGGNSNTIKGIWKKLSKFLNC